MTDPAPTSRPPSRRLAALLWLLALLAMLSAAAWQRRTGPTYPLRGAAAVDGESVRYRFLRTAVSGEPLLVTVPAPAGVEGVVRYRRYPTSEPLAVLPLRRESGALVALLPTQPPAGKLEYLVDLSGKRGTVRLPPGPPVVMRFKGDVPAEVLVPHVVTMFFSMMIGLRSALAAALGRPEARRYAWVALVGIALGGLLLGPVVQKHAFGAYWTGWPLGSDLTDNKTLVMWLAWVVAVAVLGRRRDPADRPARLTTVAAALVMVAVYLVPHSLRGSQLDYAKVEAGTPAGEAVTTGR